MVAVDFTVTPYKKLFKITKHFPSKGSLYKCKGKVNPKELRVGVARDP